MCGINPQFPNKNKITAIKTKFFLVGYEIWQTSYLGVKIYRIIKESTSLIGIFKSWEVDNANISFMDHWKTYLCTDGGERDLHNHRCFGRHGTACNTFAPPPPPSYVLLGTHQGAGGWSKLTSL